MITQQDWQGNHSLYVAWEEAGETALACIEENGWFVFALNCMRDGDMGDKNEDGIYTRSWSTDWAPINDPTIRLMNYQEYMLYKKYEEAYYEF